MAATFNTPTLKAVPWICRVTSPELRRVNLKGSSLWLSPKSASVPSAHPKFDEILLLEMVTELVVPPGVKAPNSRPV